MDWYEEAHANRQITLKVVTAGTEGSLGSWEPGLGGSREASTDSQIPRNRELKNPDPGNSLTVQWLGLSASTVGRPRFNPWSS